MVNQIQGNPYPLNNPSLKFINFWNSIPWKQMAPHPMMRRIWSIEKIGCELWVWTELIMHFYSCPWLLTIWELDSDSDPVGSHTWISTSKPDLVQVDIQLGFMVPIFRTKWWPMNPFSQLHEGPDNRVGLIWIRILFTMGLIHPFKGQHSN